MALAGSALRQYLNLQYACYIIQSEYHISYEYIYKYTKFEEINSTNNALYILDELLWVF